MRFARVSMSAGIVLLIIGAIDVTFVGGPTVAQGGPSSAGPGTDMMRGMPMMGGPLSPSAQPISMVQAEEVLRQWPAAHHLDDLVFDEVEAYTDNFYGQFKERGTGRGAIQVLVDRYRYSGRAMPEMGPNVVWNTKYGHAMMQGMMDSMDMMSGSGIMGGMVMPGIMGGPSQTPGTFPGAQLSVEQARQNANRFLSRYLAGAMVGPGDTFYGYYHFDVLRAARQVGMLSVNAATGQVWYHTWHGEFLQKREVVQ